MENGRVGNGGQLLPHERRQRIAARYSLRTMGLGWGEKMWSFPFRREAVFQGRASSESCHPSVF
jgi:hypothetical protein